MTDLTARQEAFCRAYARSPNGAGAARAAGYAKESARSRASTLLARPEIAERIAGLRADAISERADDAAIQAAKLDPLLDRALEKGDAVLALQIVAEQSRIRGFVSGAPAVQLRVTTSVDPQADGEDDLFLIKHDIQRLEIKLKQVEGDLAYWRLKVQGIDVDDDEFFEDAEGDDAADSGTQEAKA